MIHPRAQTPQGGRSLACTRFAGVLSWLVLAALLAAAPAAAQFSVVDASTKPAGAVPAAVLTDQDSDGDGVLDALDNCIDAPNGPLTEAETGNQIDTDGDGRGNACDPDFNDDGVVGVRDLLILARAFNRHAGDERYEAEVDCNGDETVSVSDFYCLAVLFGRSPAPSTLPHAELLAPLDLSRALGPTRFVARARDNASVTRARFHLWDAEEGKDITLQEFVGSSDPDEEVEFVADIDLAVFDVQPGRHFVYFDAFDVAQNRGKSETREVDVAGASVLFNNDHSNYAYHLEGDIAGIYTTDPLAIEAALDATFAEASSVDVMALSPVHGAMHLWRNEVAPIEQHLDWWNRLTGMVYGDLRFGYPYWRNPQIDYLLSGRDMVDLLTTTPTLAGVQRWATFRMNDHHSLVGYDEFRTGDTELPSFQSELVRSRGAISISQHFSDLYEMGPGRWVLSETNGGCLDYTLNFAMEKVRLRKLALIRDLVEGYDLDGFELDFIRYGCHFEKGFPTHGRIEIMTAFTADVRAILDEAETANGRDGRRHIVLAARVPSRIDEQGDVGVDVAALRAVGVESFNVAASYLSDQQSDLVAIRAALPNAQIRREMTYASNKHAYVDAAGKIHESLYLTTPEQFYTAANLALARGASGTSLFNFVYYRRFWHDGSRIAPPFEIVACYREPRSGACRDVTRNQHYFVGVRHHERREDDDLGPMRLTDASPVRRFTLDMAPPPDGWAGTVRLRAVANPTLLHESVGEETMSAWQQAGLRLEVNGVEAAASPNTSLLFEDPYGHIENSVWAEEELVRAWTLPAAVLRDGDNEFSLRATLEPDTRVRIWLFELRVDGAIPED